MHAIRIDTNVNSDHTVTFKLPLDVPIGPAEVILLYGAANQTPAPGGNGPSILRALSESTHPAAGFWNGASDEIASARDDWDEN